MQDTSLRTKAEALALGLSPLNRSLRILWRRAERSSAGPMERSTVTVLGVREIKHWHLIFLVTVHVEMFQYELWSFFLSMLSDCPDHGGRLQHWAWTRTHKRRFWGFEQLGSCLLAGCCGKILSSPKGIKVLQTSTDKHFYWKALQCGSAVS